MHHVPFEESAANLPVALAAGQRAPGGRTPPAGSRRGVPGAFQLKRYTHCGYIHDGYIFPP